MRPLMGTLCVIEAAKQSDDEQLADVIDKAFELMRLVETLMHPRHGSDLARINGCTGEVLSVHSYTWQVLSLSKEVQMRSGGVFDPCLPIKQGTLDDVELLNDHQVICRSPVAIDLGGIAKGFAIDLAMDCLRCAGCCSGGVNAGGDVAVFGESRLLHIRDEDEFFDAELHDQSLAVSAINVVDRPAEHRGYYDRNRQAEPIYKLVAVKAAQAAIADALTKCAMMGAENLAPLCAHFNAEVVLTKR